MVLMFLFQVLPSELTWKHLHYLGVAAMPGDLKVLLFYLPVQEGIEAKFICKCECS